jgi:hypothetical protein
MFSRSIVTCVPPIGKDRQPWTDHSRLCSTGQEEPLIARKPGCKSYNPTYPCTQHIPSAPQGLYDSDRIQVTNLSTYRLGPCCLDGRTSYVLRTTSPPTRGNGSPRRCYRRPTTKSINIFRAWCDVPSRMHG